MTRINFKSVFIRSLIVVFMFFGSVSSLYATELKIVTWNVREMFSIDDVNERKSDLKRFADTIKPDILCLQEITSIDVVNKIRDVMELNDYYTACSDFSQNDQNASYADFEVAVISKYPLTQILEYDYSPDNKPGDPVECKIFPLEDYGIEKVGVSRGFLWVRIDELKLTISVVHLKSSLGSVGSGDKQNAKKRELVIAAVALNVFEDKAVLPDYSYLVLGDFNVGHSDDKKSGINLFDDCYSDCENKDLYDETHALLSEGLIKKVKMKNLTLNITESTYPTYPGSPIDNIYVDGVFLDSFSDAKTANETFGSDHLPVIVDMVLD